MFHSIFRGEIEFKRGLNRRGKFRFNPLLNSISPSHPIQVQSGRWPSGRETLYDLVPNVFDGNPMHGAEGKKSGNFPGICGGILYWNKIIYILYIYIYHVFYNTPCFRMFQVCFCVWL